MLRLGLVVPATMLVALFCCGLTIPTASGSTSLEGKTSAAKQRIESVSAALAGDRGKLEAAQNQASRAAAKEADLSGLLDHGQARSAELEAKVQASARALDRARSRLKRARAALAARLVSIYMSGSPDGVDLALSSTSLDDLVSRDEYLDALQNADEKLALRVRGVRDEVQAQGKRQQQLKARVDAHNTRLAAARASIDAARAAAEQTSSRLALVNAERQGEINSLKSDINGWTRQIARQKRAEAKAAAKAESAAAAQTSAAEEVDRQLGGPYAIPTYIVMCESGGNYSALNPSSGAGGAYQILPSTWAAYGGKGLPNEASKAEQDSIAARIYADSGSSPWVCG